MPQQHLHNPAFCWLSLTGRISPSPGQMEEGWCLWLSPPRALQAFLRAGGVRCSAVASASEKSPRYLRYRRTYMDRGTTEGTEGAEEFGGGSQCDKAQRSLVEFQLVLHLGNAFGLSMEVIPRSRAHVCLHCLTAQSAAGHPSSP